MSSFCGRCGAPSTGTRFCTQCGAALVETPPATASYPAPPAWGQPPATPPAPPPAQPSVQAPAQPPVQAPAQPSVQQPGQPQSWRQAPPPVVPPLPAPAPGARPSSGVAVTNPFPLTPASDYVRDVAALLCLFAPLGMPWDLHGDGGDRWWVIVALLVAVLALPLPYVGRAGLVPGFSAQAVRLTKLGLTVPVWASVVAGIVNELVHVDDVGSGGIGYGMATAVAGALLAAQPRRNDEALEQGASRGWQVAAMVAAIGAALAGLVAFVLGALRDLTDDDFRYLTDDPLVFAIVTCAVLLPAVVAVVVPALLSLRLVVTWKNVLAAVGFSTLAAALVTQGSEVALFETSLSSYSGAAKWSTLTGNALLLAAAAALAVARPVRGTGTRTDQADTARRAEGWVATAAGAVTVAAVTLGAAVVVLVLSALESDDIDAATAVVAGLLLVTAAVGIVAAAGLGLTTGRRVLGLVLVGTQLLLTIVVLAVAVAQDVFFPATLLVAGTVVGLPCLALFALAVPPSVRRALGPVIGATGAPDSYR